MGKHAQRAAAQVLAATIAEPLAAPRRRRTKARLDEDLRGEQPVDEDAGAVGLDEIARAYEIWSDARQEGDALPAPPDFASLINSHAAASPRLEPQAELVVVSIVGDLRVEELVGRGNTARGLRFRCSRTENVRRARDTIVTLVPELIVIDVDVPQAKDLVVRLLGDPRTERIPLLVVGTFALQEEMDDYVALGAVRAFDKPVPVSVFRGACVDSIDEASGRANDEDDDDDLLRHQQAARAGWSAPLVVQVPTPAASAESAPTRATSNPHALVPVEKHPGAGLVRSSLAPLAGRRVLVADADPATVLLIGNAFRTAGCIVEETSHGEHALRAALGRTVTPDLVIVEAPEHDGPVDGVALCKAMRRDVAARDVPVLLLCDADEPDADITSSTADAVLSKAVSLKTLLGKAGELVTTRALLEERLRTLPQTSGKLRDLSVRTLLASTGETHARATVRLEDDAFVHTIVLEHGRVTHATRVVRSARDGRVESGRRAMASALSMRRGTYRVTPCDPLAEEHVDLFADTLEAMRGAAKARASSRKQTHARARGRDDARDIDVSAPAVKTYADAVVEELYNRGFVLEPRPAPEPAAPPAAVEAVEVVEALEPVDNAVTDPAPAVAPVEPAGAAATPAPPRILRPEAVFVAATAPSVPVALATEPTAAESTDVDGVTYAAAPAPAAAAAVVVAPPVPAAPISAPPLPAPVAHADVPAPLWPAPSVAPATPIAADTLFSARTRRTQILRAAAVAMIAIGLGAAGRWKVRSGHPTAVATTLAPAPTSAGATAIAGAGATVVDRSNPALPPEGTAEISTAPDTAIIIDGVERGRGPQLSVTLPIGVHALRTGIDARSRSVQISRGRVTHVDLTGGVVPSAGAPPAATRP